MRERHKDLMSHIQEGGAEKYDVYVERPPHDQTAGRTLVVAISSKHDEHLEHLEGSIDQALEFFLTDYLAESWGEGGEEGEPPKFEDLKIATRIGNWPIEQTVVTHGIVRTEPSGEEE
jgi:hypothetical protein